MNLDNPVILGGISVSSLLVLIKAVISLGLSLHWWTKEGADAWSSFTEVVLPIVAVWAVAWYTARKVTPLSKPVDVDNVPLTRPDNAPAIKELEGIQSEALKINDNINKKLTRGLES